MKTDIMEKLEKSYAVYNGRLGNETGWGCGYVTIPSAHAANRMAKLQEFGDDYLYGYFQPDGCMQEITFSERDNDGNLKIGFDTAHIHNSPIDDEDYVKRETQDLCDILEAITDDHVKLVKKELIAEFISNINKI